MAEVYRYSDPRAHVPGFVTPTLVITRTPGSHVLVTAMDKSGRIANVELPEDGWLNLLAASVEELSHAR